MVVGGQWLAVKGKLAALTASSHHPARSPPSRRPPGQAGFPPPWPPLTASHRPPVSVVMSQHTPPPRRTKTNHRRLPPGRNRLLALEVALSLVSAIHQLRLQRGLSHLRDHLVRAADNIALRLSEANGRTMGNRTQHLEAAYAECQEVQTALSLLEARAIELPPSVITQADRLGGLIYGLLRADLRARG